MAMVGQMLKPKKTEITEKLRQEINKVRGAHHCPRLIGLNAICCSVGPELSTALDSQTISPHSAVLHILAFAKSK